MENLNFPYGVVINSLSVLFGGILGCLIKKRVSQSLRVSLPAIFGLVSLTMGMIAIKNVRYLPAVALAIIVGYVLGELLNLENRLNNILDRCLGKIYGENVLSIDKDTLISIIVLFCASGTGIYGAITSRFISDHAILYTKSIMDFFTAMLFAALMGSVVCCIAAPQFLVLMLVFLSAGFFMPFTTPEMLMDFTACGGVIMLATGLRMAQIKKISLVNLLPALVLIMPLSYLYASLG
jgi:uncharacterized membrane protein YqgA involved in biofilm formation